MHQAKPAALALASRLATGFGVAALEERQRRGWTTRELGARAQVAAATVLGVEAGRRASLDVYSRLAVALGLPLDLTLGARRARSYPRTDRVHAAMGELEAGLLASHGYELAIDYPYQHYQFAGRADVLAWSLEKAALLHIENRTRFPDLQDAAGSFNAKCRYLAPIVAQDVGLERFVSQTHVMVGLWSAEVIHAVRVRQATFRALCPDDDEPLMAWLRGSPPQGSSRSFVLLDPLARPRQRVVIGLDAVLAGARPRIRGYRQAAEQLDA
jgi:transcriptional regulator with XRE-family HTH domain